MNRANAVDERTTFVGVTVPPTIKKLPKLLNTVGKDVFQKLLAVVIDHLSGGDTSKTYHDVKADGLSEEVLAATFAGLYDVCRASFRLPEGSIKKRVYTEDLVFLKIPDEFVVDIVSAVFGESRKAVDAAADGRRVRLPGLASFKWRVDVAISTSSLKRAMKPSVLMQMTLSDGRIHTFEVPSDQFHKLRYNVAFVLKEIEELEANPVMQAP